MSLKINGTNSSVTLTAEAEAGGYDVEIPSGGVGKVLQVHSYEDSTLITGVTTMPHDDTIPQISEGLELMSTVFTPKSSTSKLRIEVFLYISCNTADWLSTALFKDTDLDSIGTTAEYFQANATSSHNSIVKTIASTSLSDITFSVRSGSNGSSSLTFNGDGGSRIYGGKMVSSITITEIGA